MKKLIFSIVTLCVSFLSLAQDNSHSLSDTYFRMKKNEVMYPLGFHFYRDGTVFIRIFEEGSLA